MYNLTTFRIQSVNTVQKSVSDSYNLKTLLTCTTQIFTMICTCTIATHMYFHV